MVNRRHQLGLRTVELLFLSKQNLLCRQEVAEKTLAKHHRHRGEPDCACSERQGEWRERQLRSSDEHAESGCHRECGHWQSKAMGARMQGLQIRSLETVNPPGETSKPECPERVERGARDVRTLVLEKRVDGVGCGEDKQTEHEPNPARADVEARRGGDADDDGHEHEVKHGVGNGHHAREHVVSADRTLEHRAQQRGKEGGSPKSSDRAVEHHRRHRLATGLPAYERDQSNNHERIEEQVPDVGRRREREQPRTVHRQRVVSVTHRREGDAESGEDDIPPRESSTVCNQPEDGDRNPLRCPGEPNVDKRGYVRAREHEPDRERGLEREHEAQQPRRRAQRRAHARGARRR